MLSLSSGPSGSEKTTPPAAEMSRVTAFANFFYAIFFIEKEPKKMCVQFPYLFQMETKDSEFMISSML